DRAAGPESGRPSDDLDGLLEHDLALQRPVHRALRGDLHEPLALILRQLLGQRDDHAELGRRPALGGLVVHVHRHIPDLPPLALGVHLYRDRRTRRQARREQLLGTGTRVVAAVLLRLVGDDHVLADRAVVLEGSVLAAGCGSHATYATRAG